MQPELLNVANGYKIYVNDEKKIVAYDDYEQLIFENIEAFAKWLHDELDAE